MDDGTPQSLSGRLGPEYDMMKTPYPVITCPYCQREYVPVSYTTAGDKYTLCCHHIIDQEIGVLGYVSLIDLEETCWDIEL